MSVSIKDMPGISTTLAVGVGVGLHVHDTGRNFCFQ